MERFDAIVVGAGPAGSVTAYRLATAGASVLLLDRARFPRDKPCGGGLTGRALRELPIPVGAVVEDTVTTVEFRLRFARSFERSSAEPLILMTQRRRLDHHLAEQAAAAGADFRDGTKVEELALDEDGVTVVAGASRARGAVLIGADGANGLVARTFALDGGYTRGVALEGNVPYGAADEARYRGRAVIELGTIPGGYGWVFPKGDHVNVGVGGWDSEGPNLRAHLRDLCEAHAIDHDRVEELRGHRLPLRHAAAVPVRGRALLVGDAAGLVDPISGDGMYEAFVSARLAAGAVLDLLGGRAASLEPYATALARAFDSMAAASWGAKRAFDRFPRISYEIARLPLVWPVVEKLVHGELVSPSDSRGLARVPLRVLDRLARATGDPGRGFRLGETA